MNRSDAPPMGRPDRWAYAAGITGILAALLLIGFFLLEVAIGLPSYGLGPANDLTGSLSMLLLIPAALAIGTRLSRGLLAVATQVMGLAAMATIAAGGPLLVFGVLEFEVQAPIVTAAALALFGWVVLVSVQLRQTPAWSAPSRLGRWIGVLLVVALIVLGLSLVLPGEWATANVVFAAGLIVGLSAWAAIPFWILLAGRSLAVDRP